MDEAADPRAEERVGSLLEEKWTLEKLLGVGGMGAVYEARHRNGARAAIKLLHPELARNTEVRERFLREGYAANKVEHRSTVKVLDDDVIKSGPDEGAAYIVMELLEGESLDKRAHREKLNEREVLEVMETVLDVLQAAHDKGVIHRDLKPDNLFLAKDAETGLVRLKVLDFGLARIAEAARVTGHGLALGTPAFMSPEQAAGLPDIDGRADIFALGATAFYVFTGRHVHEAETVLQQIIAMAKDPAPKLKTIVPDASDDFCAIIDRALELEREMRYLSAAEMRYDVRAALDARSSAGAQSRTFVTANSAPPPARTSTMPPSARVPSPPPAPPSDHPREKKRGFPVGSFLLLGMCGVAWLFWPQIRARFGGLSEGMTSLSSAASAAASALMTGDASAADAEVDGATMTDASAAAVDLDGTGTDGGDASALAMVDDGGLDGGDDEEDDDEDEVDAGPVRADAGIRPPSPTPHGTVKPPAPHKPHIKKRRPRRRRH